MRKRGSLDFEQQYPMLTIGLNDYNNRRMVEGKVLEYEEENLSRIGLLIGKVCDVYPAVVRCGRQTFLA